MRWFVGLVFVLALGVMGCSETSGTGGSGGSDGTMGQEFPCAEQGINDAIAEGGGPHTFDCDEHQTVVTQAEIVFDKDVILDGEGKLTVDGDNDHRVFFLAENVTVELRGVTVTRGHFPAGCGGADVGCSGGGILAEFGTTLTLIDSAIVGNAAGDLHSPGNGGGIHGRSVTLINSTVSDNTAYRGGGIFARPITLINSTVSGNSALDCCGGIYNTEGAVTLVSSTVSGNSAGDNIGGIAKFNSGALTIINSTVSNNAAPTVGGIFNEGRPDPPGEDFSTLALVNSTVAGNMNADIVVEASPSFSAVGSIIVGECDTGSRSGGYNIESPGDTCGFDQEGDQSGVSAVLLDLQPLANNGGPTQTHAITPDSAAFNAGTCEVDEDQRGVTRPQGPACDVGAFELEQ